MSRLVDDVRIRAWRALMHVHAGITDELEQELGKAHDLPLSWYQVLVELRIGGGALRMHRLAEAATLSRSATTRLVDQIERAGLVERRVCPSDRRGIEVVLTQAGQEIQTQAAPTVIRGLKHHLWDHLTDEQTTTLAEILETVPATSHQPAAKEKLPAS